MWKIENGKGNRQKTPPESFTTHFHACHWFMFLSHRHYTHPLLNRVSKRKNYSQLMFFNFFHGPQTKIKKSPHHLFRFLIQIHSTFLQKTKSSVFSLNQRFNKLESSKALQLDTPVIIIIINSSNNNNNYRNNFLER